MRSRPGCSSGRPLEGEAAVDDHGARRGALVLLDVHRRGDVHVARRRQVVVDLRDLELVDAGPQLDRVAAGSRVRLHDRRAQRAGVRRRLALAVADADVDAVGGVVDGEGRPGRGERAGERDDGDRADRRGGDDELAVPARRAYAADASGAALENECGAPGGAAKSGEEIAGPREEQSRGLDDVGTCPHVDVGAGPSNCLPGRPHEREGVQRSADTRGKASADAAGDRRNYEEDSTAHRQQGCTQREKPGHELDRGGAREPDAVQATDARCSSRRRPFAHPDVEPPHLSSSPVVLLPGEHCPPGRVKLR